MCGAAIKLAEFTKGLALSFNAGISNKFDTALQTCLSYSSAEIYFKAKWRDNIAIIAVTAGIIA